jgi:hypothetical protein
MVTVLPAGSGLDGTTRPKAGIYATVDVEPYEPNLLVLAPILTISLPPGNCTMALVASSKIVDFEIEP